MSKCKRRVLLSVTVILSLLAGICLPALISSDNALISASSGSAPDLIVKDIARSPETPATGETVTFTVIIKNQGDILAGSSRVVFYVNDAYQGSALVDSLEPGAITFQTFTWQAQPGSYSISAVVDIDNIIAESNETNNTTTFALSVLAPDLIIDLISWSPQNPSIGDEVTFSVTVKNQGNYRAGASNLDFLINGNSRGYKSLQGIDPGETANETFTWMALAGSHSFTAVADLLNQVNETDETNNDITVIYSTAAPDLVIDNISWSPQNPSENTPITLTVTIKNQGIGKAAPSRMAYYVDDVYQDVAYIGQLDIGATIKKNFTWIADANPHTFRAVADAGNEVIENDETNNDRIIDLPTPTPDLIIQSITWSPANPLILHQMTFTVTVKNQGKSTAGNSYVYFYINNAYKFQRFLQTIEAGATVTWNISWTTIEFTYGPGSC